MKLLTELLAISEDWGSSDWRPVMDAMDRLIDEHFDGKRNKKNIEAAAEDIAPRWQEDIGHDDVEDTAAAIVRTYTARRKDTITEAARELWAVHSKNGVVKKFPKLDGDWESPTQVKAWLATSVLPGEKMVWNGRSWILDPKAQERADKKADREQAKMDREDAKAERGPKIDLAKVYRIVIDQIGNTFPDGDPIDSIAPALKRMGVKDYDIGDTIDAAMKKHGSKSEKKGMYDYMADMWDDMAGDAMHDAKAGHEAREPFVRMEDGKPVKQSNPWKSS